MTIRTAVAASGGLCTIADLARRWGITPQGARKHVRRPWFPEPILTEGGSELWLADEADAAYHANVRRTSFGPARRTGHISHF